MFYRRSTIVFAAAAVILSSAYAEDALPLDRAALNDPALIETGKKRVGLCRSCHSFDEGKPALMGPNLWGVVGRPVASDENFAFSKAMKTAGGEWTPERLDKFLENTTAYLPGTMMIYVNQHAEQRLQIIAYLSSLKFSDEATSDNSEHVSAGE